MDLLLISLKSHSHVPFFNLGLAYLIGALRAAGVQPDLALMDANRMNEHDLHALLRRKKYTHVGFGFLFDNLPRVLHTMKVIRDADPNVKVIIGGPGPSASPEYMLIKTGADLVVVGEGEKTFPHLMLHYPEDGHSFITNGVYFRYGGKSHFTGPVEIGQNLDDYPLPAWDAFPMEDYLSTARPPATPNDRYMAVITSRGCPYNCNFCYHTNEFRFRNVDAVAYEIALLQERYGVTFVQFYDDLFMSSKKRCLALCESFQRHKLNFRYRINGRVNIVDVDQLEALRDTGCRAIGYGIESGDQRVLDFMGKKTTIDEIKRAVKLTKEYGMNVTTPVMFGQPVDTLESLALTRDLLVELMDGHEEVPRTIRSLTPYPGTAIYSWALENGYLRNEEDFFHRYTSSAQYDFNLTKLSDEEFSASLNKANEEIAEIWKVKQKNEDILSVDKNLNLRV